MVQCLLLSPNCKSAVWRMDYTITEAVLDTGEQMHKRRRRSHGSTRIEHICILTCMRDCWYARCILQVNTRSHKDASPAARLHEGEARDCLSLTVKSASAHEPLIRKTSVIRHPDSSHS